AARGGHQGHPRAGFAAAVGGGRRTRLGQVREPPAPRLVPDPARRTHDERAGCFKIRGAYTRSARLSEDEAAHGVVAASAGNHAQGVALAASLRGLHSTVFMPEGAPIPKVQATRAYRADVRFHGSSVDEALTAAKAFAAESGAVLVHPFDHPDIVAGQGTVGREILEQVPDVRTVVVCTGGGGLLAGIALAVKSTKPDVRVVGVQAESAAAFTASLAAGRSL